MAFYSYIFTANYKRFFTKLKKVSIDDNRSFAWMVMDAGWSVFRYGMALTDYLTYKFYKRSGPERKQYIGTRTANKFYATVSPAAYKHRFSLKPNFLRDFAAYTGREYFVPENGSFDEFLAFLQRHEAFMTKPFDGLGGEDVKKEYAKDITDPKAYYDRCIAKRILLEELVVQHDGLNRLCPASVNTIRVMTYHNHGNPRVLWMGMRVGSGHSAVDNFSSGGMVIGIDREKGCLKGDAIDKAGTTYARHPFTDVVFDGFPIPCFAQIEQLVMEAARLEDKILVIGWDVAITPNGPVLVEGNRRPGFGLSQVLDDRGHMDIINEVLTDLASQDHMQATR